MLYIGAFFFPIIFDSPRWCWCMLRSSVWDLQIGLIVLPARRKSRSVVLQPPSKLHLFGYCPTAFDEFAEMGFSFTSPTTEIQASYTQTWNSSVSFLISFSIFRQWLSALLAVQGIDWLGLHGLSKGQLLHLVSPRHDLLLGFPLCKLLSYGFWNLSRGGLSWPLRACHFLVKCNALQPSSSIVDPISSGSTQGVRLSASPSCTWLWCMAWTHFSPSDLTEPPSSSKTWFLLADLGVFVLWSDAWPSRIQTNTLLALQVPVF